MQGKGSFGRGRASVCACFHYSFVILNQICSSGGTIASFFVCRRGGRGGARRARTAGRKAEGWAVTCPGLALPSKLSPFRHTALLARRDCGDRGLKATTESLGQKRSSHTDLGLAGMAVTAAAYFPVDGEREKARPGK